MTLLELFHNGGPIMWPLLVCSLIVGTVIIDRAVFWFQLAAKRDRVLLDTVLYLAEYGKWEQIRKVTAANRDHVIRVLVVGIMHREYDMGPAMEAEAELILRRMNRFMPALDTMITIAPLLGILGTVLGIISSFEMLATAGIADPKLVTAGIAQALITTATGLIISIVAVVPYNYLNTRIDQAAHTIEKYATSLEVVFKKLNNDGDGQR